MGGLNVRLSTKLVELRECQWLSPLGQPGLRQLNKTENKWQPCNSHEHSTSMISTQLHITVLGACLLTCRREKVIHSSNEEWNQHHRWRPRSTNPSAKAKGSGSTSAVVGGGIEERDQGEEDEGEEDERSKSSTCLFSSARRRRQGKHGGFWVICVWL